MFQGQSGRTDRRNAEFAHQFAILSASWFQIRFWRILRAKFVLASRENSSVRQPAVIDRLHFEGCRKTDGPNFGQRSEFGFLCQIVGVLVVPGSEILEGLDSSCALNSIRRTGKMQPAQTQESKVSRFGVRNFQLGWWLFGMFQEENRSFTA